MVAACAAQRSFQTMPPSAVPHGARKQEQQPCRGARCPHSSGGSSGAQGAAASSRGTLENAQAQLEALVAAAKLAESAAKDKQVAVVFADLTLCIRSTNGGVMQAGGMRQCSGVQAAGGSHSKAARSTSGSSLASVQPDELDAMPNRRQRQPGSGCSQAEMRLNAGRCRNRLQWSSGNSLRRRLAAAWRRRGGCQRQAGELQWLSLADLVAFFLQGYCCVIAAVLLQ